MQLRVAGQIVADPRRGGEEPAHMAVIVEIVTDDHGAGGLADLGRVLTGGEGSQGLAPLPAGDEDETARVGIGLGRAPPRGLVDPAQQSLIERRLLPAVIGPRIEKQLIQGGRIEGSGHGLAFSTVTIPIAVNGA